jgi:hypothetical protein
LLNICIAHPVLPKIIFFPFNTEDLMTLLVSQKRK